MSRAGQVKGCGQARGVTTVPVGEVVRVVVSRSNSMQQRGSSDC